MKTIKEIEDRLYAIKLDLEEGTKQVESKLIEKAENGTKNRKILFEKIEEIEKDLKDIRLVIMEIVNNKIIECVFCKKKATKSMVDNEWHEGIFWGTDSKKFAIRKYNKDDYSTCAKYLICNRCKENKQEWEIYRDLNEKKKKGE